MTDHSPTILGAELPALPRYSITARSIPGGTIWEAKFADDGEFYSVREVEAYLAADRASRAAGQPVAWLWRCLVNKHTGDEPNPGDTTRVGCYWGSMSGWMVSLDVEAESGSKIGLETIPLYAAPQSSTLAPEACAAQPAPAPYPLPDSLYPDSKDWLSGDYAARVEWLHTMYEARKADVERMESAPSPQQAVADDNELLFQMEMAGDGVTIGPFSSGARRLAEQAKGHLAQAIEDTKQGFDVLTRNSQWAMCREAIDALGVAATQARAAAPALAREPLTKDRLKTIDYEAWRSLPLDSTKWEHRMAFARAIERAHGITADSARAAAPEPLSMSVREVKP